MSDKSKSNSGRIAAAAIFGHDDLCLCFASLLVVATERVRSGGFGSGHLNPSEDARIFNRVIAVMDKLSRLLDQPPARVVILSTLLEDTADMTAAEKANVKRFAATVRDELTTKPALPSDADAARN